MRILIVDTAFLGDLLLATPLIRAAAELADGGVDLLTSAAGAAAVRNHPLLGHVRVLHKRAADRGLGGLRRGVGWVRSRQADVALLPRRSLRSLMLTWLAGVPRRISVARRGPSRLLLTDSVPFRDDLHQVERNLELLRPLGVDPARTGHPGHPLEAFPSAAEKTAVRSYLAARGLTSPASFYVLAPGSVWATKRWPAERFADLAVHLARLRPVLVMGGPAETPLVERILALAAAAGMAGRVHGALEFAPTAGIEMLGQAAALVANDSGALHMGQAAGTPVVALYGPTAPELGFAPRGAGHRVLGVAGLPCRPCGRHGAKRCPQTHWRCMLDLDLAQVLAAVRAVERPAA
jgi:heptosyltransferase-2